MITEHYEKGSFHITVISKQAIFSSIFYHQQTVFENSIWKLNL